MRRIAPILLAVDLPSDLGRSSMVLGVRIRVCGPRDDLCRHRVRRREHADQSLAGRRERLACGNDIETPLWRRAGNV